MKKIIIIIVVAVVLILGLLIAVPVLFKPALMEAARNTLNRDLQADINFKDLKVSLFRSFPYVDLELVELSITGNDEFAGDTLLIIPSVQAKMKLASLFRKRGSI